MDIYTEMSEQKPKLADLLKNPERMRVMCAEACGFTEVTREQFKTHSDVRGIIGGKWAWLPEYPKSLDAMAVAEATLTEKQIESYVWWLNHLYPTADIHYTDNPRQIRIEVFALIHATAIQRLSAFLLAKGLVEI